MDFIVYILLGVVAFIFILVVSSGLRVVQQYERGVIFRLGRLQGAKGPGLFWIWPMISKMRRIDLRIVTLEVAPQEVITRDNVTLKVTVVVYFYVVRPSSGSGAGPRLRAGDQPDGPDDAAQCVGAIGTG